MIANALGRLFPNPDQPMTFDGFLNGKFFCRQWTVYAGSSASTGPALHEFLFYLELDLAAIGQGGTPIHQRTRLICDDALKPVRYQSQARGTKLALSFEGDDVLVDMPDGSKQKVPSGGAQFIIESNMTGQQALMLALMHERGLLTGEANFNCFVVNGLLATPYSTRPAPDLKSDKGYWLRSSHEEQLLMSNNGVLLESISPAQAVTVRLVEPPPALPEWREKEQLKIDRPVYQKPADARFKLDDVAIPGPVTQLGATLTIPDGRGPFPAVLFLSGSGTHDRNGIAGEIDIGSHEVVDHLANRGFFGLRYDTRGAGSTKIGADAFEQGLESIIADARAALAYLRSRPEVDGKRLFLIGHSQGGNVALQLARENDDLKGVVLMAAMGRNIEELLVDQTAQHSKNLGLSPEQIDAQVKRLHDFVALALSDRAWVPGEIPDHLYVGARNRKWIVEHMHSQATDLIGGVKCPILVAQGAEDFQVLPTRDAEKLVAAARAAGRNVSYLLLPGLDHLFKKVSGNKTKIEQYFDRTRHVDSEFLAKLDEWLVAQSG
jgi:dienelactone hydrolase